MTLFGKSSKKRSRLGSGVHRAPGDAALSLVSMPRLQRLLIVLAFVVLVATITKFPTPDMGPIDADIDAGMIALETVLAGDWFESEDLQATRAAREAAEAAVPRRYRVDGEKVENQLGRLQQRIDALLARRDEVAQAVRDALRSSTSDQTDADVVLRAVTEYAAKLKKLPEFDGLGEVSALAVWLMPSAQSVPAREFAALEGEQGQAGPQPVKGLAEPKVTPLEFAYADRLAALARGGLEYVLTTGIWGTTNEAGDGTIVILRDSVVGDLKLEEERQVPQVPTPARAHDLLRLRLSAESRALAGETDQDKEEWARLQNAAWEMAKLDITDTLSFAEVETAREREKARSSVRPVMKEIKRFEIIQDANRPWTEQSIQDAKTYWSKLQGGREPVARVLGSTLAHMILVALCLAALLRALPLLGEESQDRFRSLNVTLLLICGTLILGRAALYFEPSGLLVPVTAGAILLAILFNVRLAAAFGMIAASLVSVQYGYDWSLLIVIFTMSLAGALSIFVVRKRSDMAGAAIKATGVGLVTMLALTLAAESPIRESVFRRLLLIGLNGGMCMFIVPGLLSPLERLFGITTDIQLLEYSDLNNEVLSRLAIEVPATYAHSLMLGQVGEAAADAIGANGLLTRVCAYYHDVGKLRRPEYFSENQNGTNVHDGLSPRLSARAIASHVTEGVEIAREYHLPQPVVNGILEHHGTSLISFFYQQAVEQQKHGDIREEDFRYPGPKPQRRETAILMICDASESAVRSIKNPNEERVREVVDKVIASRWADRQFDECHLTLKELDTIAAVVAKRILTSLHTRIAYPEKDRESREANVIPLSGGKG